MKITLLWKHFLSFGPLSSSSQVRAEEGSLVLSEPKALKH